MFIDSHCHLDRIDLAPYAGNFSRYLEEAARSGLERMLCVSINLGDYPAMRALIEGSPGIDASVGIHPNETCDAETSVEELAALARDPAVVAVGETGLDYFRDSLNPTIQEQRFRLHIRAALAVGKPLIVHSRSAADETLRVLREEGAGRVGGVFHCFTEDWDTAKRAMDINFLISFSGVVTFKSAVELQSVAERVPADSYLIETDSPYLAPVPLRGKTNYPHYVMHVASALARLRCTDIERIGEESAANYFRLFGGPT